MRPGLTLRVGSDGMYFGWAGELAPSLACFEAWSRARPFICTGLGRLGSRITNAPCIGERTPLGRRVVWCEGDGAWASWLRDGQRSTGAKVIEGARRIALAGDRLFAADRDGIVSLRLDRSEAPVTRHIETRRSVAAMSATTLRDEALLAVSFEDEPSWVAVSVDADANERTVRHRTDSPPRSIRLVGAGGRAALALDLDQSGSRFGVLGHAGRVLERPRAPSSPSAGQLTDPLSVWVRREFFHLARDRMSRDLVVHGPDLQRTFTLPDVDGPFDATFRGGHLYVLTIAPQAASARFTLWRCEPDGRRSQRREETLETNDATSRREALNARALLEAVAARLSRREGYREAAQPSVDLLDPHTLEAMEESRTLRVEVTRDSLWRIEVVSRGAEGSGLGPPTPSLLRIADWIRARLPAARRQRAREDQACRSKLGEPPPLTLARVERSPNMLRAHLSGPELPPPGILAPWLRHVWELHAQMSSPSDDRAHHLREGPPRRVHRSPTGSPAGADEREP